MKQVININTNRIVSIPKKQKIKPDYLIVPNELKSCPYLMVENDTVYADITKEQEEKLKTIRNKRNQLLNDCDFMAMPDYPLTNEQRTVLNDYRQALRDLPNNITDINNVTYPTLEL